MLKARDEPPSAKKENKKGHKHFVYSLLWFLIVVRLGIEPRLF